MTLPIARDLSSIGVRVNTVAPGLIDTPIYSEGLKQKPSKLTSVSQCFIRSDWGRRRTRVHGDGLDHQSVHE